MGKAMKKFLKWLDNFWYHYKWVVLLVVGFGICIGVMTAQFIEKDSFDAVVLYTGPKLPTANETKDMESAFASLLPGDYDGDNKKTLSINALFLMTDEQLQNSQYQVDEEGNKAYVNTSEMVKTKENFSTQIFVGEALVCMLDPAWYDMANSKSAFVALSDFGYSDIGSAQYDENALYLKKTAFGSYFDAFDNLPDDTLICFRKQSSASSLKNEEEEIKRYEYNRGFFSNILKFSLTK